MMCEKKTFDKDFIDKYLLSCDTQQLDGERDMWS